MKYYLFYKLIREKIQYTQPLTLVHFIFEYKYLTYISGCIYQLQLYVYIMCYVQKLNLIVISEQAHPSLVSTAISQTYAFGGVSSRSVSLHLQADRRLFRGPHAELTVRCLAVVPSQPARQASVTVSLRPSHQQLRNQKLEWPNSAGNIY